jgi:hypothetical protein
VGLIFDGFWPPKNALFAVVIEVVRVVVGSDGGRRYGEAAVAPLEPRSGEEGEMGS